MLLRVLRDPSPKRHCVEPFRSLLRLLKTRHRFSVVSSHQDKTLNRQIDKEELQHKESLYMKTYNIVNFTSQYPYELVINLFNLLSLNGQGVFIDKSMPQKVQIFTHFAAPGSLHFELHQLPFLTTDCLGVIDGTHVRVKVPRSNAPVFVEEKIGQHKTYLQLVILT
ncbi:hypothetical protein Fmac_006227 [Flemingia macrophylla]|uniref:Ribosomal protein S4 n=1 Tax=Flemingia macrophylla TaxID=520843 RepID=A0ABD1NB78_9FABA